MALFGEVTSENIADARQRIAKICSPTPLVHSLFFSQHLGFPVYLKLENLNATGSFKIRGAANKILSLTPEEIKRGVVAASAGNHAQGVAYCCQKLGSKAKIFMPRRAPMIKISKTKGFGADIVLHGDVYDEAYAAAKAYSDEHNIPFVHAYADQAIIEGQGTIGLELLESGIDFGTVVIPVGGGGLIAGIAQAIKATKPSVKILGVQTEAFPAHYRGFHKAPLTSKTQSTLSSKRANWTLADGVAVRSPDQRMLPLIAKVVDDISLVKEPDIAATMMEIMERNHLLVEGCGALALAALKTSLQNSDFDRTKPVIALITGGNIDVKLLRRVIDRGLIFSHRLLRVRVVMDDTPGCLSRFLDVVAAAKGNVIEVRHDRSFASNQYLTATVEADIEIDGEEDAKALLVHIDEAGYHRELLD